MSEKSLPPRVWLDERDLEESDGEIGYHWASGSQGAEFNIQYLSVAEHEQILREARALAFEEASNLLCGPRAFHKGLIALAEDARKGKK